MLSKLGRNDPESGSSHIPWSNIPERCVSLSSALFKCRKCILSIATTTSCNASPVVAPWRGGTPPQQDAVSNIFCKCYYFPWHLNAGIIEHRCTPPFCSCHLKWLWGVAWMAQWGSLQNLVLCPPLAMPLLRTSQNYLVIVFIPRHPWK